MAVEVSTPDFPAAKSGSTTREVHTCAPAPVGFVAESLARDLYYEILDKVRPPRDHKVVPHVTVTISYHFKSTEEK